MIYPSGTEEDPPQEIPDYENFPYSVPQELVIKNALDADIPLIEALFESAKNQPLTEESVNQLIQPIYETGHYSLVIPRIDTRTANHKLELKLYPLKQESIILIPSVDYQGLLANSSFSELTISLDTQFRNITGTGSTRSWRKIPTGWRTISAVWALRQRTRSPGGSASGQTRTTGYGAAFSTPFSRAWGRGMSISWWRRSFAGQGTCWEWRSGILRNISWTLPWRERWSSKRGRTGKESMRPTTITWS